MTAPVAQPGSLFTPAWQQRLTDLVTCAPPSLLVDDVRIALDQVQRLQARTIAQDAELRRLRGVARQHARTSRGAA